MGHGAERDQGTGVPLLNPQPFLGAFVKFRHPSDGHIARLKPWLKVYDKDIIIYLERKHKREADISSGTSAEPRKIL
jgi:hypothetical protein